MFLGVGSYMHRCHTHTSTHTHQRKLHHNTSLHRMIAKYQIPLNYKTLIFCGANVSPVCSYSRLCSFLSCFEFVKIALGWCILILVHVWSFFVLLGCFTFFSFFFSLALSILLHASLRFKIVTCILCWIVKDVRPGAVGQGAKKMRSIIFIIEWCT